MCRPFPARPAPRVPLGAAPGAGHRPLPAPCPPRLRAPATAGPLPAGQGPSPAAAPARSRFPPKLRAPRRLARGEEPSPLPGEARAARCPPLSPATPAPSAPSPAVPGDGLAGPGSPRLRPSWPWRRPAGTAPQRRLAVPRSRRPPLPVRAVSESMATGATGRGAPWPGRDPRAAGPRRNLGKLWGGPAPF